MDIVSRSGVFCADSMCHCQRFDTAMIAWSELTGVKSVVNSKPVCIKIHPGQPTESIPDFRWEDMPQGATLCDVGSGVGFVPLAIAKAHPHLSITLQDLPEPLEQAKTVRLNYPIPRNPGER